MTFFSGETPDSVTLHLGNIHKVEMRRISRQTLRNKKLMGREKTVQFAGCSSVVMFCVSKMEAQPCPSPEDH